MRPKQCRSIKAGVKDHEMPRKSKIVDQYGEPFRVKSRFDAVAYDADNKKHWSRADTLSPRASVAPGVLTEFRARSRYEYVNNSYCKGMVSTLSNDTIGPGPMLQIETDDEVDGAEISDSWDEWCDATGLCEKLRIMRQAKAVDGEAFALQITNRNLPTPAKLDIVPFEADLVESPFGERETESHHNGIDLDAIGYPRRYWVLNHHPGSPFATSLEGRWYSKDQILHIFHADRPGQLRGTPEIGPALPLFAQLRRWTLAVIASAETAADMSVLLETDATADFPADDVKDFYTRDFERRMMVTLPFGWKASQLRAEQPTTAYAEFKREVLNEIARCLNMPFNVAAGNSSDYNFASGRLDHQVYDRSIEVERKLIFEPILEVLFSSWLREHLSSLSGIAPSDIDIARYPHTWIWKPREHVDPQKVADATITLWEKGLLTDEEYFKMQAKKPQDHYNQLRRQNAIRAELGIPLPGQNSMANQ